MPYAPDHVVRDATLKGLFPRAVIEGSVKRRVDPGTAKLVLTHLVMHRNPNTGQCNPSLARLAGETGLCQRSVQRAILALQDVGLVSVGGKAVAGLSSCDYTINDEMLYSLKLKLAKRHYSSWVADFQEYHT